MGFSVDKRHKLDKPLGTIYSSTESRPIKVADTAPIETTRADEVTIETAKTGKVTAVVTAMSIFSKKKCKLRSAYRGNEKPSCQKRQKVPIFRRKIPAYQEAFLRNQEKARFQRN
jgi:hypothetical protein